MRQELESVDFYIAQGYSDIAVDTLEMLEPSLVRTRRSRRAREAGAKAKRASGPEAAVFPSSAVLKNWRRRRRSSDRVRCRHYFRHG